MIYWPIVTCSLRRRSGTSSSGQGGQRRCCRGCWKRSPRKHYLAQSRKERKPDVVSILEAVVQVFPAHDPVRSCHPIAKELTAHWMVAELVVHERLRK